MIALSSFRPFGEHAEYDRNQLAAKQSWVTLFSSIFYFNPPEPQMEGPNVSFVPWEPWPKIRSLTEFASGLSEPVAILNADIVLSMPFRHVQVRMKQLAFDAALSRRYQFEPGAPLETAKLVDAGLDIFIASPQIWKTLSPWVPDEFRIGHNRWDTFMLGVLNYLRPGRVLDFTPARVVFHPAHEGRRQPFAISDKIPIPFLGFTNLPRPKMR